MVIRKWVQQAANYGFESMASGLGVAGAGVGYVTELVGSLRLFGTTAAGRSDQAFDEKHYFLVPDRRNVDGYALMVTRVLPEGIPPINDLPKRRILHVPHEGAEPMLRSLLIRQAQAHELSKPGDGKSLADRAREVADFIDVLDGRMFGGILLIGGLVAIFNPLAGAAIAAKSLIPSLGMLASKYGLRVAEESLSQADIRRKVKQAEKEVQAQFRGSETRLYLNPILLITEKALRTGEDQYDPLLALHAVLQEELTVDERRLVRLASIATLNVFDSALKNGGEDPQAGLGREDLRFFAVLKSIASPDSVLKE